MADARGETVSVKVGATATDGRDAEFGTAGTVITFRGFMLAYEEGRDEAVAADEEERRLPPLTEGDELDATALEPESHSTTPPARFTEATLVRALEERGIGRPSTYASILGTILDRGYVRKVGQALVPTFLAFAVTNLLEQHFGRLVDYEFTALMEDDLDRIAVGRRGAHRVAAPLLLRRQRRRRGAEGARLRSRRHRRAADQHDRDRRRDRAARRPLRPLHRAQRRAGHDLRRDRARRAHRGEGRGAPLAEVGRARARSESRDRPGGVREERPLRPVRDRGRRGRREAENGVALQVDVAGDGDARGRAAAALAAAHRRRRSGDGRGDRRLERQVTARSSSAAPTPARSRARSSSSRSRSTRRSRCSPSRSSTAAGRRHPR